MDAEIQLISDGDGLAVIGDPADVEKFLVSQGLPSKDLGLHRLRPAIGRGAGVLQAGSEVAANSGRWMKLTEESARVVNKFPMVKNSQTGNLHATLRGQNGQFVKNLQFASKPTSLLTNPAILAGAAGIMAQYAMQQSMEEITEYLAAIDEKVDDILRSQKDSVLADMIGVDLIIEEAMTVRKEVGRVSEVTWSKVQATAMAIARTQGYALRQLDALAEKLERKSEIGDIAKAAKDAESLVREWLAVLARCFQLQDASGVLELDRVLDASPEDLDRHRLGLRAARQQRLELISRTTMQLLARMDAAALAANTKVLLHPVSSRSVVDSSNHVASEVIDFQGRLGIDRGGRKAVDARQWRTAAAELRDKVVETGAEGVDTAMRLGNQTFDLATEAFRPVDLDGDGIPDKPRALTAAEGAGTAIQEATAGAADMVSSFFRRRRGGSAAPEELSPGRASQDS